MCGRYTLTDPGDLLTDLGVEQGSFDFVPRFNIAPTQNLPVVRAKKDGGREIATLRWGLIPSWAQDEKIGNRMINARSETAAEKPAFRTGLRQRRCGILADGFYEWQKVAGGKQPIHLHLPGRKPFLFAGIWERWTRGEDGPIESFTIFTTSASDIVAPVHDRMPVILPPDVWDLWLDPKVDDAKQLSEVLVPYEGKLELTPVSRRVNNPREDSPACLTPAAPIA